MSHYLRVIKTKRKATYDYMKDVPTWYFAHRAQNIRTAVKFLIKETDILDIIKISEEDFIVQEDNISFTNSPSYASVEDVDDYTFYWIFMLEED